MKRVLMLRPGAPGDVVRVEEAAEPGAPDVHEALVELVASPIHPADVLTIYGQYMGSGGPMPKALGKEGVGRVVAVGAHVKHIRPGDMVPVLMGNDGVWQERHLLNAETLVTLPGKGDPLQYAMAIANPATALQMLREVVPVKMGDWVIQNAANSSVGQYLIQLAKRDGIRTVNVVRRDGLASQLHNLGADVVLTDGPDLAQRVAKATNGAAIRLGIDAVAGEAAARLAGCLAPEGTLCNYGLLSGKNLQVSPGLLIGSGLVVRGFWLVNYLKTREQRARVFGELIPLVVSGMLRAEVEKTYRLADAVEAITHAARGERSGKILLVP